MHKDRQHVSLSLTLSSKRVGSAKLTTSSKTSKAFPSSCTRCCTSHQQTASLPTFFHLPQHGLSETESAQNASLYSFFDLIQPLLQKGTSLANGSIITSSANLLVLPMDSYFLNGRGDTFVVQRITGECC